MPRVRKILRDPGLNLKNYYLVDANFLVNKYIHLKFTPNREDYSRLKACQQWWDEIELQIKHNKARVYISDIHIAESFKVLAKKYYLEKWFKKWSDYNKAKKSLIKDIHIPIEELVRSGRKIKYHDISTSRDIIISVDRFFRLFMKHKKNVQIADFILVATAKYLIDFYDIPHDLLHIITLDKDLWEGAQKICELPRAYDPTKNRNEFGKVFVINKNFDQQALF